MVALKRNEIDSFVARPAPTRAVVLVFGPDAGLVRERVDTLITASVNDLRDPFALVRLDGDALASEPSRLAEEADTVPLFGGRRAIWVKAGSKNFAAAVETVLATPPRVLCEKHKSAAVIACYPDDGAALARLIDEEMRAAGLSIARDARDALMPLIGGDRQASRGEIRKLALYAHGKDRVELDDVLAVVADASELALNALIDAALAGRAAEAEAKYSKAIASGTAPGTIMSSTLRHVTQLHRARVAFDAGESPDAALGAFIPPVHFSRRAAVESALTTWTPERLARAMENLAEAARDIRRLRTPIDGLDAPIAQRALLALATQARRRAE
jgi:DNA polymerase-3 subunit delta